MAYRRGGHLVLFAPPWRAHKPLDANSLEALGIEHPPFDKTQDRPSSKFRWREDIKTCPVSVTHPIQLLEWDKSTELQEEIEGPDPISPEASVP